MAEEALAELIDHQGRVVKLADIEKAVCDVFGLEPDSLQIGSQEPRRSAIRGCWPCTWPASTREPR